MLACWLAPRLWPHARTLARARRPYVIAGGFLAAFAVAATIMQLAVSSRHASGGDAARAVGATAPDSAAASAAPAQSMQAAVAGLEARLAGGDGTDADWELLAKAYEFLGRADAAQRAHAHIASPSSEVAAAASGALSPQALMAAAAAAGNATGPTTGASAPAVPAASLEELRRRVHDHPDDAPAWLALAELHRSRHDDRAARDALARVVALHGMTAQAWADYADVLAALAGGSLAGAAGSAIDQALTLDPANPKALWLKASQAHEQRHFVDALAWWHRLRTVLPPGSPDLQIIDANIAEDTELGGPSKPAAGAAAAPQGVGVSAAASIDGRLDRKID